jgi:AAA+ superfamily predicted ATPase
MNVIVLGEWKDEIKKFLTVEDKEVFSRNFHYASSGKMKIDISDWADDSLKGLYDFLGKKAEAGDRSSKMSQTIVQNWMELKTTPDGKPVGKLEHVEPVMKLYLEKLHHRWIFMQNGDEHLVPWFVSEVEYENPREDEPRVRIKLNAMNAGNEGKTATSHITIRSEDIRKRTMSQILEAMGVFVETPARIESYKKEVENYLAYADVDGFQMSVTGKAKSIGGWYERGGFRSVGQNGRPAKMVIDPPGVAKSQGTVFAKYWNDDEEVVWDLPIHPVFEMFDLDEHADYRVHVNNTTPYIYDDTVIEKLVLEKDIKDFLTMLIEHSKDQFEDIVGGKAGGTIVGLVGNPGIGKTLTAEVYSELMHRPLYRVQSSQLGIKVDEIEKNLKEILQRSERWGAILLLDEADVYVRKRGEDLVQNAIVGVFLRVLEYYRGVLFMTSNMGIEIDEAIISRMTALFDYQRPDLDDQKRLWKILTEQNGVKLTDAEILKVLNDLPKLTGRDIKNILKLAMVMAKNKKTLVTPDIIKFVSKYRATRMLEGSEE